MEEGIKDEQEVHETPVGDSKPEDEKELSAEEIADLKKRADVSSQNFERAKKLEAENKALKEGGESKETPKEEKKEEGLSQLDVIYLAKADIHDDDVSEVMAYSQKTGLSVKESHEYLKPILDVRAEERKTASATHTKSSARSGNKNDGDSLLKKAEQSGEVPDSEEGMKALAQARLDRKKKSL